MERRDVIDLTDSTQTRAAKSVSPCPLCQRLFNANRIHAHVDKCLDGRGDEDASDKEPSPLIAMTKGKGFKEVPREKSNIDSPVKKEREKSGRFRREKSPSSHSRSRSSQHNDAESVRARIDADAAMLDDGAKTPPYYQGDFYTRNSSRDVDNGGVDEKKRHSAAAGGATRKKRNGDGREMQNADAAAVDHDTESTDSFFAQLAAFQSEANLSDGDEEIVMAPPREKQKKSASSASGSKRPFAHDEYSDGERGAYANVLLVASPPRQKARLSALPERAVTPSTASSNATTTTTTATTTATATATATSTSASSRPATDEGPVVEKWEPAESLFSCSLCTRDTVPFEELAFLVLTCDHFFCRSCLRHNFEAQMARRSPPLRCLQCPDATCGRDVNINDARDVLDAPLFADYDLLITRAVLEANEDTVLCPNATCGNVILRERHTMTPPPRKTSKGALAKRKREEHALNNRFRCRECQTVFCAQCKTVPYHQDRTCAEYDAFVNARKCRHCGCALPKNSATSICKAAACKKAAQGACTYTHPCGHPCYGVRDEREHLRCLRKECMPSVPPSSAPPGSATAAARDTQIGNDFCNICWTDSLDALPSVQLTSCRHIFHYECVRRQVHSLWPSPSISMGFLACPLCNVRMSHPSLRIELQAIGALESMLKRATKLRLQMEDLEKKAVEAVAAAPQKYATAVDYGLSVFAFYFCFKCRKPYFGGMKSCAGGGGAVVNAEDQRNFKAEDLVCGACSSLLKKCAQHGANYIEWKCRFCCRLATFFCGGVAHFCTPCHTKASKMVEFRGEWPTRKDAPLGKCKGAKCPLGGKHKPNGQEDSLGCAMCRALVDTQGAGGGGVAKKAASSLKVDDKADAADLKIFQAWYAKRNVK